MHPLVERVELVVVEVEVVAVVPFQSAGMGMEQVGVAGTRGQLLVADSA